MSRDPIRAAVLADRRLVRRELKIAAETSGMPVLRRMIKWLNESWRLADRKAHAKRSKR